MEQLKERQEVVFTIKDENYKYKVCENYLKAESGFNDQIFSNLKLDKLKLADSAYGYKTPGGIWPESNSRDFAALTRLVEALFPYCDKVTVDRNIVYSKSEKTIFKEPESSVFSSKLESSDIIDFESIVQKPKIRLNFI